jgi:hypothetical protein
VLAATSDVAVRTPGQGPPEDFELPEDMQLDGDGGAGHEDSGSEDGQDGVEADAAEDGGPMPEVDNPEHQPRHEAEDAQGDPDPPCCQAAYCETVGDIGSVRNQRKPWWMLQLHGCAGPRCLVLFQHRRGGRRGGCRSGGC